MIETSKKDRGSRRKDNTRAKLLAAIQKLMTERSFDSVNIHDITEEADVGLGTFYNHFESKTDALKALAAEFFILYITELEKLIAGIDDPAEIISVSYRYTITYAKERGMIPIISQMPSDFLNDQIEARVRVDIGRGINSGRFRVDNLEAFVSFVSSMTLGVMENLARGKLCEADAIYTASYFLRLLGISEEESMSLIESPLPRKE